MKSKTHFKKQLRLSPGYLLLALWLIFTIYTVGWIVCASFSTTKEIFTNGILRTGFHWDNYTRVLEKHKMSYYLINSLIYSVCTCAGVVLLGAPAAYVLGRFHFRFKNAVINAIVITLSIPYMMVVLPLFKVAASIDILGSRITLITLYIGLNIPFTVFFLSGYFSSLPSALEEAAEIDGAGPVRTYWNIMFPLVQPGIMTLIIFQFISTWNEYFIALIFGNSTQLRPISTGLQTIIQSMKYSGDWAGLFAGVVVVFVPTVILYVFLSNRIIIGVTGGAIKE